MEEVDGVVEGHDPREVLEAASRAWEDAGHLTQLGSRARLDRTHVEGVAATVLRRRAGATRGWLKVQDGCDRKCAFCATRLARGRSRSRDPGHIVAEAQTLARSHPELVITGVHIGHYGRDLEPRGTLTALVRRLLDEVPGPRFRLGSIEATEIDDGMIDLLAGSGGRLAPHLHMPLQSGADPVLRRMRRWHTREHYRRRAHQIAAAVSPVGLGADVITGFPRRDRRRPRAHPRSHRRTAVHLSARLPVLAARRHRGREPPRPRPRTCLKGARTRAAGAGCAQGRVLRPRPWRVRGRGRDGGDRRHGADRRLPQGDGRRTPPSRSRGAAQGPALRRRVSRGG